MLSVVRLCKCEVKGECSTAYGWDEGEGEEEV